MINTVKEAVLAAEIAALQSPDTETKVGAVLIDETLKPIRSHWNSFLTGHDGFGLPKKRPEKYTYMLHAERNLLFDCAKNGVATAGKIVICTLSPCPDCLRALWQAGITQIFYKNRYRLIDQSFTMADLKVVEIQLDSDLYQWTLSLNLIPDGSGNIPFFKY